MGRVDDYYNPYYSIGLQLTNDSDVLIISGRYKRVILPKSTSSLSPQVNRHLKRYYKVRGGRKRLPKFKFSAKFPIGLHVILQIQIKKIENDCYLM